MLHVDTTAGMGNMEKQPAIGLWQKGKQSFRGALVDLRPWVQYFHNRLMDQAASRLAEDDLKRSAMVFSPHFDDETLGCGGTILRKRAAGARVTIVFMTDGGQSHRDFMAEEELRRIRAREGIAAAGTLGVDVRDVVLLNLEETRLAERVKPATRKVAELLTQREPLDVFVPYHREPPADHAATHRIVTSALRMCGKSVTVYEYPIWCWQFWPWTSLSFLKHRKIRRILRESVVWGARLARDFRWRVCISDVVDTKRAALGQHRSQMTQLNSDPNWPTLGDVWNGGFLERFFQDHEVFSRHTFRVGVS